MRADNNNAASGTSLAAAPDGTSLASDGEEYVTVTVADQIFGLPIGRVHEVFIASARTAVPRAPGEIVGLLNLRGRVVTALCLRRRLGLPDRAVAGGVREMAVGLEHQGEAYGLLVDGVGEVMRLAPDALEPNPVHMDQRWAKLSRGVHRLDDKLLIVLDVDAALATDVEARAA